jgi:hypothetical protein
MAGEAQLDGLSLEEVVAQIKATGGNAFSRGSSAYRGVSRSKGPEKCTVQFTAEIGNWLQKTFDSELEAARQYDAWCKRYGK